MTKDEWVIGYYSSLITPEKLDFTEEEKFKIQQPTTMVISQCVHSGTLSDMRRTLQFNEVSGEITRMDTWFKN
jgi:hypothetical protein